MFILNVHANLGLNISKTAYSLLNPDSNSDKNYINGSFRTSEIFLIFLLFHISIIFYSKIVSKHSIDLYSSLISEYISILTLVILLYTQNAISIVNC